LDINKLLPDLNNYKNEFLLASVQYPLNTVPFNQNGLLKELPTTTKTGWPWDMETAPNRFDQKRDWPKITIVTPSYNQGAFIEETIRSVLLQNYPNLEYIVMDGGSTDDTRQILEKYSPWISFWQSKKDNGQGHAINLGFSLASGSIYGWINSDDFYMDSALLELEKGFRNPNVEIISGDGIMIDEPKKSAVYQKSNLVKRRYLFVGGIIMQHSTFWRSQIHQPILEKLNCAVDSELWFRIIPNHRLKHLAFPLGVARIQPDAKTHHKKYQKMWEDDNQLISEINQFEKKFYFFNYFFTRLYKYEVKLVQSLYKSINKTNEQIHLSKLKEYQ
jgi:glycosyltransferase involved in cell wall biosynthesis